MNPGSLRHRISFLEKQNGSGTTDSDGYSVPTWIPVATVWADVKAVSSREYFQAAAVQAQGQVRFTIRYRKDIIASMKIRFDGQDYEIKGAPIDADGRRRWLQVMAEVITSG